MLVAILTGGLLAWMSAPVPTEPIVVSAPPVRTPPTPLKPSVKTPDTQPSSRKAPTAPSSQPATQRPAPASPRTLEQLARIGQSTTEEASECFRKAWLDGRLTDDQVALHMTVDPQAGAQPLHVTAPNTEEHLWDAEACLSAVYAQVPAQDLTEASGGMIWSLRLPTKQWAETINDGTSP